MINFITGASLISKKVGLLASYSVDFKIATYCVYEYSYLLHLPCKFGRKY
jgi:hypothetical protein